MDDSRRVYSTESGRMCKGCGRPVADCACRQKRPAAAGDGIVRIRREVKGRGGKTVTVAGGFQLADDALAALAGDLKRRCGTGGAVKNGEILIQGDHRETLLAELRKRGFAAKIAGG
jgi:translation initiation factor 1